MQVEKPEEKQEQETAWWQPALALAAQISGWIAGPVIVALFLGRWLDQKYGTGNTLFYVCIGIAFVISNVGLVRESMRYAKKLNQEAKLTNKDKKPIIESK